MDNKKIILVGCGKMGSALLAGWIANNIDPKSILVVQPGLKKQEIYTTYKVDVIESITDLKEDFEPEIILFAVKPQIIQNEIKNYKRFKIYNPLFISIITGKTINFFEEHLGRDAQILRTMPNLPSIISCGITAFYANDNVVSEKHDQAVELFQTLGEVIWLDNEDSLHAITAISGSGPAYVFLMIEVFTKLAKENSFKDEMAELIAINTILGSARLAATSKKSAEELRIQVTSPAGTTEAALKFLLGKNGLEDIMREAINAAISRSKELSS